ncbi:hypothetical protein NQ315_017556 [Exocentrus adspersus]|uniref:Uncharacterized protein n=1 Tax=Exocentrus adspersus TaxID=1586481 RepID=A0AAV8VIU3_9CUCU|nr:hypothetical protein NQ315_017556 [Exocentrus adspersus]
MDKWLVKAGTKLTIENDEESGHDLTTPTPTIHSEADNHQLITTTDNGEQDQQDLASGTVNKISVKTTSTPKKRYLFINKWTEEVEFSGWLIRSKFMNKKGYEFFYCKVCKCNILAHKSCILRHKNSRKHNFNWTTSSKITDAYKLPDLEKSIRHAEIKLSGLLTTNNLSFLLMDVLGPLCGNLFTDSKIATSLAVKRTKATAIVKQSLGLTFMDILGNKLKQLDMRLLMYL